MTVNFKLLTAQIVGMFVVFALALFHIDKSQSIRYPVNSKSHFIQERQV